MAQSKKGWAQAFTGLFVQTDEQAPAAPDEGIDIDALLRETSPSPLPETAPEPELPVRQVSTAASSLTLGHPLTELYKIYKVPASPKSIEEITAFLDGLKGMPESVQLTALRAMDDADPDWSITDVVLDGRYKVDALRQAKQAVDDQLAQAHSEAAAEIAEQEAYIASARSTISEQITALHEQIEELQQLLLGEESQVEDRKSAANERIAAIEQQVKEEHQRIETEIERITTVVAAFGPMVQES